MTIHLLLTNGIWS